MHFVIPLPNKKVYKHKRPDNKAYQARSRILINAIQESILSIKDDLDEHV
jgi:hypothetical protein